MTDESSPSDDGSDAGVGPITVSQEDEQFCELLATDGGRQVLAAMTPKPAPVSQIVERCSVSRATVYRYVRTLRQLDLIEEQTTITDTGGRRTLIRLRITDATVSFGGTTLNIRYVPTDSASRFEWLLTSFRDVVTDPSKGNATQHDDR